MRLAGKIAIVTGAGSGIGKATVDLFRREGATVIGADIKDADVVCDAGNDEQVAALIENTVAIHGGLDIVFANAGVGGGLGSIFEQTPADWTEILRVNLIGPFLAIKHGAPHLKARGGGSIIATASVAGLRAGAGGPAYSASKAGVIALTKSLGKELAGHDIAVNCITPAAARTRIFEQMTQEHIDYMLAKIPRARFVEVEEIAAMVAWMVSKENSFTTGAVFDLSGGRATY